MRLLLLANLVPFLLISGCAAFASTPGPIWRASGLFHGSVSLKQARTDLNETVDVVLLHVNDGPKVATEQADLPLATVGTLAVLVRGSGAFATVDPMPDGTRVRVVGDWTQGTGAVERTLTIHGHTAQYPVLRVQWIGPE